MKKEQIENVKKDIKSKSFNELKNGVIVEPVKPIIKEEETIYIKKEKKDKKQPKIIYYESETESEEEIIYKKKSKPKVIKEDKKEEPKEIIKPVEPIIKEIKNKIIFCWNSI